MQCLNNNIRTAVENLVFDMSRVGVQYSTCNSQDKNSSMNSCLVHHKPSWVNKFTYAVRKRVNIDKWHKPVSAWENSMPTMHSFHNCRLSEAFEISVAHKTFLTHRFHLPSTQPGFDINLADIKRLWRSSLCSAIISSRGQRNAWTPTDPSTFLQTAEDMNAWKSQFSCWFLFKFYNWPNSICYLSTGFQTETKEHMVFVLIWQ